IPPSSHPRSSADSLPMSPVSLRAHNPPPRRGPSHPLVSFPVTLLATAALLFVSLAAYMRLQERKALASPAIHDQLTRAGVPRPLAEITQALRDMKLVTVEVDSKVASETGSESWRGDV